MSDRVRGYAVYICPACGKQVSDQQEPDGEGGYVRGHYHEPPSDGWTGPDPWFDARRIIVYSEQTVEASPDIEKVGSFLDVDFDA